MRRLSPALAAFALSSAFALGGFAFLSAASHAFAVGAASAALPKTAAPLAIPVRHRHRWHRRREKANEPKQPAEARIGREQAPKPAGKPQAVLPEPKEPPKPAEPAPPPPAKTWSAAEILAATKECNLRLSGLHMLYAPVEPIRDGACGLPAPIRLEGFESECAPPLHFAPAPALSCKMAEALRRWFDAVVQPKAKAYLHATVVRMRNLSNYDCRSRYDDPAQRISEHAFGNALDIGEFVTAKGERVAVEDAWNAGDERAAFLRDIHAGACRIFGTTLGPEANEAHRNHFHLDMIERRRPLCDFTPEQARARELEKHAAVPASAPVPPPPAAAAKAEPPVPAVDPVAPRSSRRRHRRRHW
jgi:hypothetical protein